MGLQDGPGEGCRRLQILLEGKRMALQEEDLFLGEVDKVHKAIARPGRERVYQKRQRGKDELNN